MDMTDRIFTLEVKDEYSETKTNVDETFNDDVNFVVLSNGTMIVKNPKVTKYIEKLIEQATRRTILNDDYFTSYCRDKPWERDTDCLKYDAEIQKKMKEHSQKESSDVPLLKETTADLLEIKLKDTDSVPEVYYKGERIDEMPKGLVDVYFYWRTKTADSLGDAQVRVKYCDNLEEITCIHNKLTND
ncbi:hypothetical protein [Enterococcus faecalis]|uniref:hypothetical protein n=1 Tax=Enterococcus faecalis TaxID=1351 RepID=UPI0030C89072